MLQIDLQLPTPTRRPRRLRTTAALRRLVREIRLTADDLIYPLFVVHGEGVRTPVASMPGVFQLSVDEAVREARRAHDLGIPAVLLFGIPAHKDAAGSEGADPEGAVQRTTRAIKEALPDLLVITDVCLCEYTAHGHCGPLNEGRHPHLPDSYVLNDETLAAHAEVALSHARAGADVVAPSGMMDGLTAALRAALDGEGFQHVPILAYSVKYASSFYGPFRDAAESAPAFGDRRTHQMDPANGREALREAALDVEEGADFLMVKPALPYLDVLARLRDRFPEVPLVAYHVSGEYAMLKAAAANGWLDERAAALEALTAIKRAGADAIITYYAPDAARWLSE
ncbi:MAG TPA: porphobilinogen synthase [Rubricoccaceae bacterium]|nr:porphobilinogen synthase [Rubricoccaceae bacterium]